MAMNERVGGKKVLLILHQGHSTPGRVGAVLDALGARLDIRRPSLDEPLPRTLADHDGVMVFGGPVSANDDHDWIKREIDWLAVPLREQKPLLGICLGAQFLARQLGARVFSYPDRRGEVGYRPIAPTPAADRLCAAPFPRHVYHWHFDGFDLPRGAELLASGGADFPNQAFSFGAEAIALQFHPEVTYAMMCRWTTRGHERLSRPGAQPRQGQLDGWFQHDRGVANWLGAFLPVWLAGRASRAESGRRQAGEIAPAARWSPHDQGGRGESRIGAAI
ncbi:MAG: glutamine amidotransferase [Roseiarcus sp.]|jgi:GMP synthase (glutamine-hydrolysing)